MKPSDDTRTMSLEEARDLHQRWLTLLDKVRARADAVFAEAGAGIGPLVTAHAADAEAVGRAFGAVRTRVHGLMRKVKEAYDELNDKCIEHGSRDDVTPPARDLLRTTRDEAREQRGLIDDELDERYDEFETLEAIRWAHELQRLAEGEMKLPTACTQCGGVLGTAEPWRSSNVTCTFCQAVNAWAPGPATAIYFSVGVDWLAQEAALSSRKTARRLERALERKSRVTAEERAEWLDAVRAFWTTYYECFERLHPGFAGLHGTVGAAVQAQVAQYDEAHPATGD